MALFQVTENTIKSSQLEADKIQIKVNNKSHKLKIPSDFQSYGYQNLVAFFIRSPVCYAIVTQPKVFSHSALAEFWYTCRMQTSKTGVEQIVGDHGKWTFRISPAIIRQALHFPDEPCTAIAPAPAARTDVLTYVRYDGDISLHSPKRAKMGHFWSYFFGVITYCLGHKSGSHDQLNNWEVQMGHCLMFNLKADYAQHVFDKLKELVRKKKRDNYVPFNRFLCLIFEHLLESENATLAGPSGARQIMEGNLMDKKCERPHPDLTEIMQTVFTPADLEKLRFNADTAEHVNEADAEPLAVPEVDLGAPTGTEEQVTAHITPVASNDGINADTYSERLVRAPSSTTGPSTEPISTEASTSGITSLLP